MNPFGWNFEHTFSELPPLFFSEVKPTPVREPKLVVFNAPLAQELGLNPQLGSSPEGAFYFAGNAIPEGAKPLAQAYAGHQFGNFTQLGDGRAILLGEHITPKKLRFDIQLKGSGRTPYSRRGDGRAALGPMLREYLISEAMHALGIPTTRSLAVVTTGESVQRERALRGAILTRVAQSHVRVGTFEWAAARGDAADIAALALYTLERHFPDYPENQPPALTLLKRAIEQQAKLVAQWMQVGFIHGVMNTDNMALSGETIDYGPCAFMDTYHPNAVFSSIDEQGRYAFANQARIALWNLERLAETLIPILDEEDDTAVKVAEDALDGFAESFNSYWLAGMRKKMGLAKADVSDQALVTDLLKAMHKANADYTNTFRRLSALVPEAPHAAQGSGDEFFTSAEFQSWSVRWKKRLEQENAPAQKTIELMNSSNPTVIPRNHRVEAALKAAEENDDFSVMERLLSVLRTPFSESAEHTVFAAPPEPHERVTATFCGT
ncbi:MAG: hypothetical protein RIR26_1403 [Pseudomonadota bacterium]|jgi:uncharacterized protein YdiU (UPF0061 family)